MKTKVEIIKETAAYYNLGNRSVAANGKCLYNGPDGKQCALARCSKPIDAKLENTSAYALIKDYPEILKPEYAIPDKNFWNDIQDLHDYQVNWSENGLSEIGERKVKELIEKYQN